MSNPADLSLIEAADAVKNSDVTSAELLEACWNRMEEVNPTLNATIWTDRKPAQEAADMADLMSLAGEDVGPLHGVPTMHKDMYYREGEISTCGSSLRGAWRPTVTATVLDRLTKAGAYVFGGLNMAEFAQNPTGHNKTYGDCHNPWNPPYITGGSSSGSGASVAARFNYMALGSDTGGSIRLPASACGVVGLKPTQTRVSRHGVMPLSFSADNVGPLTRTVGDCARVMNVIAGYDELDPTSSREPVPDYEAALTGALEGTRIGVPENFFFDRADKPIIAAIQAALPVLRERGATITRVKLPVTLMDAITTYGSVISRVEAATIHAQWMRYQAFAYGVHISARMYSAYAIPAPYYVEALSRRGAMLKAFADEVFSKVDVLISPTIRTCLPTLAETDVDNGPEGTEAKFMALSANTRPFNYLGLPAISIPCGFDPNGCPIGLQIAGRPFGEGRVMRVADAFQQDTDFHTRKPPILKD